MTRIPRWVLDVIMVVSWGWLSISFVRGGQAWGAWIAGLALGMSVVMIVLERAGRED